jgi:hypothetical protein
MEEKHGGGNLKETSSLVQTIGHRVLIRKTVALPEKPEVGIAMAHILSISRRNFAYRKFLR